MNFPHTSLDIAERCASWCLMRGHNIMQLTISTPFLSRLSAACQVSRITVCNCSWRRWFLVHSKDKSQRPKLFFLLHSRWPNVTSRAPMEFKWRASGRQKLAVGLVKFHKGEKGRLTDVQSYTSHKYCFELGVFITKMIYKQKFQGQWISKWRFKFVRKIRRGKKKSVERRMRKHARAYSKFYSE